MKQVDVEQDRKMVFAAVQAGEFKKGEQMVMLRQSHLSELSELLGRNIMDVDDLLLAARNVTTLSVNGVEGTDIVLEPYLLNRLKSRCHPTERFPDFLRARVKELLCGYAGC